jgi:hypothetical protein
LAQIVLQPKQSELDDLFEGPATWIGYGGSRGGAKSGGIDRVCLRRRLDYPGSKAAIVRRVWDDVMKNHVQPILEAFPDLVPFYANKEINMPNGSRISFMAAETEADVTRKFWGPEFMDIFVDQAEQFTEKELRQIKMAARAPNQPEGKCKLGLFYNPGGVSVAFLKRIFYDKVYEGKERAEDFAFIQAYGWDNVEWARPALMSDGLTVEDYDSWDEAKRFQYFVTRTQYGRDLDAQPEHIRIGHLLGRFDRFAGQYFGAVFDKKKMQLSPDQVLALVKPWWTRWLSLDWGVYHHTGVLWHARGKVSAEELRKATGLISKASPIDLVVTYKTLMMEQQSEVEIAEAIVKNCNAVERRTIKYFFIGPIGPERKKKLGVAQTVELQIGRVMRKHGMPEPTLADHDRIGGWRLMYNQMRETSLCATQQAS